MMSQGFFKFLRNFQILEIENKVSKNDIVTILSIVNGFEMRSIPKWDWER